jgi:hypothetical protein
MQNNNNNNNNNIQDIWKNAVWTEEPRNIINNLNSSSLDSKLILILRHSQRFEPKLSDVNQNMELTQEGRSIARLFGMKLPKNRIIRLFHSPVNRCKETAEEIHVGFKEIGGESILKGECAVVWRIGINNKLFMSELQKHPDVDIFFRWASGFYTQEEFPSLTLYCQRAAEVIWKQLKLVPENGIDIYISHDYHLNALRYGWFGFPPLDKLVGYLGGFIFTLEENYFIVSDYGEIKTVEPPHWWKEIKKVEK